MIPVKIVYWGCSEQLGRGWVLLQGLASWPARLSLSSGLYSPLIAKVASTGFCVWPTNLPVFTALEMRREKCNKA